MGKWKAQIILASVAFVIVALLTYRALRQQNSADTEKRMYLPNHLQYMRSFSTPFLVVDVKVSSGALFLYNATDMQIVETDSLGGTIRRYGKRGDAIGEFRLISGWDVDSNGIYLTDERSSAITEFSFASPAVIYKRLRFDFNRSNRIGSKRYLMKCVDHKDINRERFRLLDITNDSVRTMNYPFPSVPIDLALDGILTRGQHGESFYYCHWAGWFFCIDSNGTFVYKSQTIDQTPPPKIEESSGHLSMDESASLVNISLTTDDNNVYILSRAYSSKDDSAAGVVDAYARKGGEYIASFSIPPFEGKRPRVIAYSDSGLYVVQSSSVVYYRFVTGSK